jgi:UDP-N-acetylglucosamine 2-epimerase (non-hydrolysing)
MKRFEPVLEKERPDAVIVVGDVNSTIACALVASKMTYPEATEASQRTRPLIVHVEAGLRSRDRSMPEEINRLLTDSIADLLFVTEADAVRNLVEEGIPKPRIHFVGNTMVDTLLQHRARAEHSSVLEHLGLRSSSPPLKRGSPSSATNRGETIAVPYGVVTLHRPSNVDDPAVFRGILDALLKISQKLPLIFPVHPRTFAHIVRFGLTSECRLLGSEDRVADTEAGLYCVGPLGYLDFLRLMSKAKIVLTDSGGIQEETTVLGVPCVTLRENTERPVTITEGTNILAGMSPSKIVRAANKKLREPVRPKRPKYWDGRAGKRIVTTLSKVLFPKPATRTRS